MDNNNEPKRFEGRPAQLKFHKKRENYSDREIH